MEAASEAQIKRFHSQKGSPVLWAVGSGKGGVGKSLVTSSLAISLTKLGHSVCVVDFDFCAANLHSFLNVNPRSRNLSMYFSGEEKNLEALLVPTEVPHLSVLVGQVNNWGHTQHADQEIEKLIVDLRELKFDHVLIDLGAGSTDNNLQVMQTVDKRVLVTTPEPTSIENLYRFMENYVAVKLRAELTPEQFQNLQYQLSMYHRNSQKPFSFRNFLAGQEISYNHLDRLTAKPIYLIVNESRCFEDEHLGHSIKSVVNKYFDLSINYLGFLNFDNSVWQCVRSRKPVLIHQPFTPLVGQFLSITKQVVDHNSLRAVG